MKKIIFPILVVILLLATAVPAFAKGGRSTFTLVGYIKEIGDQTFDLEVVQAGKAYRGYIGSIVTINTTGTTRFLLKTEDGSIPIEFGNLSGGYAVSVYLTLVNQELIAIRVTVGADLIHLP